MKINNIFLVSIFVLAIITLGAVSAAEEAGNLTVSDDAGEIIESPVDEIGVAAVEENSGSDVIGDGSEVPMNISIPDEIFYGESFTVSVSVPENANGDVSLYIDGEEQHSDGVYEGSFYYYCSIDEFGEHVFEANYASGEDDIYSDTVKEESYFLNNTQYKINLYNYAVYGENLISYNAPYDIRSDVVVTFKGNRYQSIYDDENGQWVFEVPDLEFGNNEIGVYYSGDEDFAEYSDIQTVEAIGKILSEHTADGTVDVSLTLPDDATGKLTVYSHFEGYDGDEWVSRDVEIGSDDMKDGKAVVSLTDLPTGENSIYANFTGNYEVEYLYEYVTVEPKVTVPKAIIAGDDSYVVVEVTGADGSVSVSYESDDYEHNIGFADIENGQAKISLAGLFSGEYYLDVHYQNDVYEWQSNYELYVVVDFDFNVEITDYPKEIMIKDNYPQDVNYYLPGYADGELILKVDGKVVDRTVPGINDDSCSFCAENLTVGEHTLTLDFVSDTQKNSSDSVKFNVVVAMVRIPDEIIENYENENGMPIGIYIGYSDDSTGNYVISIDGEELRTVDFADEAYNSHYISLSDVARGIHNVTVTVNDDKYGSVSESNIVDFDYVFAFSADSVYGKNTSISIIPPQYLGNGDLTVTVDGKVQDWEYNPSNQNIRVSSDFAFGRHDVVVQYAGDELYPAKDQKFTFNTGASFDYPEGDVVEGTDVGITLVLPDDAKGSMKIAVLDEEYDYEDYSDYSPLDEKTIPLVNGRAYYSFKDLKAGQYRVVASYIGDDYYVDDEDMYLWVVEGEGMDWGEESLVLGDNKTVTFTARDNDEGVLYLTLYRILDKFNDIEDNYILLGEFEIPLVDGAAGHTFDNLTLGCYHIRAIHESDDGPGYQGGHDFYVNPTKTEAKWGYVFDDDNNRVFIELPDDATGKAILTIQPNIWEIDLDNPENIVKEYDVNGSIIINLPADLPAGDYDYLVNYTGNYGNYLEGFNSIIYGLDERFDPKMEVSADEIAVGEDAVIDISLPVLSVGNVTVAIGDDKYDLQLNKGKASLTISDLKAGNYDVNVSFNGDERFIKQSKTAQLVVSKKQAVMDVEITGKDPLTVNVNVAGATGKVKVNGKEANLVNGKASVELSDLSDGYNAIAVDYDGDANYDKANATVGVFVMAKEKNNATITVDGVDYPVELVNGTAVINTNRTEPAVKKVSELSEITIGDDQTVSIVLADEDGKAIAAAPIAYTVNGNAGTVNTDANGKFTVKGENGAVITISYAGNDNITGINTTLKLNSPDVPTAVKVATQFNISDRAITLNGYAVDGKAGEEGIHYATELLDANGKPLSNAYIEFAVNNKIYNRTTYENGSFRPYNLNMIRAGRYTMAFNFAGDDNYTNAFACVCVDLDKKPITISAGKKTYKVATKTKKYTVALSTIKGLDGKMYLSPKTVELKVNGNTYTGNTKNGEVTFKLTNLNKKGKYIAKISVAGDKTYEDASASVKLTVK